MTVQDLIDKLQACKNPQAVVQVFDAESGDFEAVTGMVFDPEHGTIELYSDDIS